MKKVFKISFGGSLVRTIIYTIGHMCIAITCLMIIDDVNFKKALQDEIVEISKKHDLYILSDEIYSNYSNKDWTSILSYNYEKSIINLYIIYI